MSGQDGLDSAKCECGSKSVPFPLYDRANKCAAWACERCLSKVLSSHPTQLFARVARLQDGAAPRATSPLYVTNPFKGSLPDEPNSRAIGVGSVQKVPM